MQRIHKISLQTLPALVQRLLQMAITNEMHKSNPASERHALLVTELHDLGKYINAHSTTSGKKGSPASANDPKARHYCRSREPLLFVDKGMKAVCL